MNKFSGAQIAALSPTYPNQVVICNSTGSGFTVDTAYIRNSTNTGWNSFSVGKHLHDTDLDSSGGLLSDVITANLGKVFWINLVNPAYQEFSQESGSGGSASNDTTNGRIALSTGTTNGGYFHLGKSGVMFDFAYPSKFMVKAYATADTYVSVRLGAAMESVNAVTTTTRKYGLEGCDSAGTARNYEVIAANGSTRSNVTSSHDLAQASYKGYTVEYTPGVSVKFYVNGVINTTNSSNVPSSSRSSGIYNFGAGIKTNNTTSKNFYLYGAVMAARVSDDVFL